MLLQNSHGDFSSKQNTVFLYQKFKIVISDDQDCVISDDRSQLELRPVYHKSDDRIKAHIFINIITRRMSRLEMDVRGLS